MALRKLQGKDKRERKLAPVETDIQATQLLEVGLPLLYFNSQRAECSLKNYWRKGLPGYD
jgi:hypothetical protein